MKLSHTAMLRQLIIDREHYNKLGDVDVTAEPQRLEQARVNYALGAEISRRILHAMECAAIEDAEDAAKVVDEG